MHKRRLKHDTMFIYISASKIILSLCLRADPIHNLHKRKNFCIQDLFYLTIRSFHWLIICVIKGDTAVERHNGSLIKYINALVLHARRIISFVDEKISRKRFVSHRITSDYWTRKVRSNKSSMVLLAADRQTYKRSNSFPTHPHLLPSPSP